jgi:hypothetical protein
MYSYLSSPGLSSVVKPVKLATPESRSRTTIGSVFVEPPESY